MNEQHGDESDRPQGGPPFRSLLIWLVIGGAILAILMTQGSDAWGGRGKELEMSELMAAIRDDRVKTLKIEKRSGLIRGEFSQSGLESDAPKTFTSSADMETISQHLIPLLKEKEVHVKFGFVEPSWLKEAMPFLLYTLLFGLLFYFLVFRQMRGMGGGGILNFGKSRAIRATRDKNRKTFKDVAGIDEAREEVSEIIEFLKNPQRFLRLGGRLPHGVLLIGTPGSGKTLLAKAIAGEADVPFFSISGSDFVEMFVGVGASRVRDLFEQAKQNSPCIIFLDEIDAVGRRRANDLPGSGMETAQTLNAILVEMDGFTTNDSIIVIAATNRPDVLDPALLRPGRFDRHITVDLPDMRGRKAILKVHTKNVKVSDDVDLEVIARGTPTFSGAELENLVNEAALIAVMRNLDAVDMDCLEEARDKVRFGKEKNSRQMDAEDRRATAYHEAGHAILMRFLPHVTPLHKVSIIPRGRALGVTMQLPEKDEYNLGKKRILGEITVRLGGRAAEEMFLDDVTNGAANDFEQATKLARNMICEWGMSDLLGLIHYDLDEDKRSMFESRDFSEASLEKVDDEVRRITDNCYKEACRIIEEHRSDIDLVVEALLEFEVLSRDEFDDLLKAGGLDELRAARKKRNDEAEERLRESRAEDVPAEDEHPALGESNPPPLPSPGGA